ncbi:MAG: hypothetical protein OJJ54_19200 [Pseudonocardia sp.]|nr:hypothetical protein [Pseudonocardia sp.]
MTRPAGAAPGEEIRRALPAGREVDLRGAVLPASVLVELLTAEPPPGAPVLRLRRASVTGTLRLTGADVPTPVELRDCVFAQDGFWRLEGASQWISSALVAGWILATTAAAGAARILKRV